ncbi:hypothetical protein PYK79_26230 [Streptomyces sp. ID05-04B]|uniref:hypothetical protein n=1 Tax=unclassified Streptomyces TaxID=2593676 RepID=UPI000D198F4B|nr:MULTISPECIES: hypothetical protein [unclassified Streptomyces]AVV44176.1 hypothetical protein C6376_24765 [Streptomyces sp. P3]MDX5566100.1 hypothetical protein [Streptomyces sp. ID05-04B]
MNHRLTSARLPKAASALVLLCAVAALTAGAGTLTDQSAQHQAPTAGSIVPAWNNTGSAVPPHPPVI